MLTLVACNECVTDSLLRTDVEGETRQHPWTEKWMAPNVTSRSQRVRRRIGETTCVWSPLRGNPEGGCEYWRFVFKGAGSLTLQPPFCISGMVSLPSMV